MSFLLQFIFKVKEVDTTEQGHERPSEGEYIIVEGSVLALEVDPAKLNTDYDSTYYIATVRKTVLENQGRTGLNVIGIYHDGKTIREVISFRYHKEKDGQLEEADRVVILTGWAHGVHTDHKGQEPADYLIGVQIGTKDDTGEISFDEAVLRAKTPAKNFSMDCVVGGPRGGNPVLANSYR